MSDIFLKNELTSIFDTTVTESNVSFPKLIKVIDKANKTDNYTSSVMVQQGGNFSATSANSSVMIQQGGNFSATSANSSTTQNINKLISMLTSESEKSTETENLEQQLYSILNQNDNKPTKQNGGNLNNVDVDDIKKFFINLKSQGVKVDIKLNNQNMSDFFGLAQTTTTEIPKPAEPDEPTSSTVDIAAILGDTKQMGGAKKKKSSNKTMDGGVNAGFQAFLNLKKYIAEKLGISNGKDAAKVAGAVQKDMKEKHPGMDAVNIAKEGMKHFNANMNHYKQMIPTK